VEYRRSLIFDDDLALGLFPASWCAVPVLAWDLRKSRIMNANDADGNSYSHRERMVGLLRSLCHPYGRNAPICQHHEQCLQS